MKTVYLHIGRGKTGTTSLQGYLARRRAALAAAGVHYLHADDAGRGCGHQQFAKSFIAAPPGYMIPAIDPERIRREVAAEIRDTPATAFLISSENFPLADPDALAAWFAAEAQVTDIRIIFFVRSQDELLESEYNQMVKLKRESRPLMAYAEQAFEGVDYFAECERWAAVFGRRNLLCRIYDGGRRDVVARFLSCLPLGADFDPEEPGAPRDAENRALGARALSALRLLNMVEIADRPPLYRRLASAFEAADLPAVLLGAEEARTFRARFADSNARFSERYLGQRLEDLGGRRYGDAERDRLHARLRELALAG